MPKFLSFNTKTFELEIKCKCGIIYKIGPKKLEVICFKCGIKIKYKSIPWTTFYLQGIKAPSFATNADSLILKNQLL